MLTLLQGKLIKKNSMKKNYKFEIGHTSHKTFRIDELLVKDIYEKIINKIIYHIAQPKTLNFYKHLIISVTYLQKIAWKRKID